MSQFVLPILYPILDIDGLSAPIDYAKQLLSAGLSFMQLRSKQLDDHQLTTLAKEILKLQAPNGATPRLIINDRLDVCTNSGAAGIHLGQDDLSPSIARKELGKNAILGLSTHNVEQVESAAALPVDYIGFGPVFESSTKSGHAPVTGLVVLANAVAVTKKPLVAIGGITAERCNEIFKIGVTSVAIISDLARARNVAERANNYFERYRQEQPS